MTDREVVLTGYLVCADAAEAQLVRQHLPRHVELTRDEPGCVAFDVTPTNDGLSWRVDERFADPAAFEAHQQRVAESEWGSATAAIERQFTVVGVDR